jgi:AraC family transcriptional regulator of arabinose operon
MVDNHNKPAKTSYTPPPGVLVSGHFHETHGYEVFRPEGTRDWLLTLTLGGSGRFSMEEETLTPNEGDIVLLPPGTPHHYYAPRDGYWEFVWAHFIPELRWLELLRLPQNESGALRFSLGTSSTYERLKSALLRLVRENRHTGRHAELLSLNALEEALIHLGQYTVVTEQRLDDRITDTLNYLIDHLNASHNISSLASRVALSPSRFSHLFKEQTGDSVMETLLKLRLKHGARLLKHAPSLVSEVAAQVGFQSPFYFTKQFTAMFGVSPSEYRRKE